MKKVGLFVAFACGIGLTVFVLANPFGWSWLGHVRHGVLGDDQGMAMNEASDATDAGRKIKHWRAPMDPTYISDKPGKSPMGMDLVPVYEDAATQPTAERKIKYWRAPMDATFISDGPGKSPMGMDLIPVYEDEADEQTPEGTIKIDPVFVQNMGVQSLPIERVDIPFTIRTVGTLAYNDGDTAWVNTKYEGWIEKVYVNYVGEPVAIGQKLFEIYSPQLVTTQNEYLQAIDYTARMEQSAYPEIAKRANSLLKSSRERLAYWDITDEQITELETTHEIRRTLAVVSPASGLVVEKMDQALEGMFVKAGMNLYKIVDLSTIWAEVDVFENQIPWLEVGRRATVGLPYEPGKSVTGRIRYLYPSFNEKTRTMKVSIELPNPGQRLRADMYVNVTFEVPSAQGVLAVPEAALIHSGQRNVVVLDRGNGTFQVREVSLGVNGAGLWEVREGLEEGDVVVVSAQFLIDSESNLQEAIRKMVSEKSEGADNVESTSGPGHVH